MTLQLHEGDALAVLSSMPASTVDVVIADPPYNSGGRTNSERNSQSARGKYVSGDAQHDLPDFTGDNRDQRSYITWLTMVLSECLRVSRDGAHCLVFTDWRQMPATSDAVQAAGWTWQGTLSWYKPINRPRRGGFRAACEYILWGSKGSYDNTREIYLPGHFSASQPGGRQRRHITQKPVDGLLSELVKVCPEGGTVLDPFMGSGSTGEAALATGREFVGIELSRRYYEVARERLSNVPIP
ncbi:site-specific DNA-methyltransferase [Saccharothrix sp. AJ9571]|nr:site-specific DNA-methyltransferase [Saccharothrix sp. AJ9571]